MGVKSFKVEKLIRDKMPAIMRAQGITVHERIMDQEEFIQKLKNKLLEEAEETKLAKDKEELLEELADVLEVVQALSTSSGLSLEQIEQKRIEKRMKKGGFESRVYNHRVDIDETNHVISYYVNKPSHYPEVNNHV